MEIQVRDVQFENKTGKKIRAELRYNQNTGVLKFVLFDRVNTVYIDANPNKTVEIPAKWIQSEGESDESDTGQTGNISEAVQ